MVAIPQAAPPKVYMKRPKKAARAKINKEFLNRRIQWSENLGYGKQKWVYFCEVLIERRFQLELYEARQTVSKYITIRKNNKTFKVRFSNHKPCKNRE